jgi:hypothetical protein
MNQLILDIDIDRFVEPVVQGRERSHRPDPVEHLPWDPARIKEVLEGKLGLSEEKPVPGILIDYHDQLYAEVEERISDGRLVPPFDWIHLDGHDDIGGMMKEPISPANFLLHCVKAGWIENLFFSLPSVQCLAAYHLRNDPFWRIEVGGLSARIAHLTIDELRLSRDPDFLCFVRSPSYTPQALDPVFYDCAKYVRN